MIKNKNFHGQITPSIIDIEYQSCNFQQPNFIDIDGQKKSVRIFPGDDTPRTFINCAMGNCEPPPNSILIHCNTTIKQRQVLVNTEVVEIDGDSIEVKDYADIVYGAYKNGEYVYRSTPLQIPCDVPEVI